jgi:hypothetical protein
VLFCPPLECVNGPRYLVATCVSVGMVLRPRGIDTSPEEGNASALCCREAGVASNRANRNDHLNNEHRRADRRFVE